MCMTTGQKIKAAREKKKIKQQDLAKKLGVSAANISQYEKDKRNPKLETLRKIAAAIGVPVRDLIGDSEWDKPGYPPMKELFDSDNWNRWVDSEGNPVYSSKEDFEEWTKTYDPTDPPLLTDFFLAESPDVIKKEPASEEDGLDELITMYRDLIPDNRAKLLELCRLYLNAQGKKE